MVRRVAKRQLRRGMSLMEPAPEEPQMDYEEEEEDDLADLLEEEPAPEEPMYEDEESGMALMNELDRVYKALDDRDNMILQLAKGVQKLAKRVLALEDDDDMDDDKYSDEYKESAEYKAKKDKAIPPVAARPAAPRAAAPAPAPAPAPRLARKDAPEGDFTVGGDDDLGDEVQQGGETQVPGLTAGQPQGIAQKAAVAKALESQGWDVDAIVKATGLIKKDDKWSNFGDKDSDIPMNAPVTPDTKDWDEDFSIVPGSGNAPTSVKGIGSVAKTLEGLGVDRGKIDKLFEGAGFIRKAQAPTVGAGAQGDKPQSIEEIESVYRGYSFQQLNQFRTEVGDL